MKKIVLSILALLVLSISVGGCGSKSSSEVKKPLNFAFMEGVTALTAARMISESPDLGREVKYDMLASPDLLSASILQESADMALIPSNLAVQAHNKGLDYVIAGTSTWGNLYIVGTDEVESLADLESKKVHAFGRGLTPELVLRMVLEENGLDLEQDIDVDYVASAAEIAPLLASGRISFGVLPEPALSAALMQNPDLKVLFDLNELWADAKGVDRGYPQSCLVIKREHIENDSEFVEKFLAEYEDSIDWAIENPEKLGDILERLSLGPNKRAVLAGMERMNIGGFPISDSLKEYEVYYKAVMDFAPDFIGGAMPDEEIYYRR